MWKRVPIAPRSPLSLSFALDHKLELFQRATKISYLAIVRPVQAVNNKYCEMGDQEIVHEAVRSRINIISLRFSKMQVGMFQRLLLFFSRSGIISQKTSFKACLPSYLRQMSDLRGLCTSLTSRWRHSAKSASTGQKRSQKLPLRCTLK